MKNIMNSKNKILVPCTSRKSDDVGSESSLAQLSFPKLDVKRRQLLDIYTNTDYTIFSDKKHKIIRHQDESRGLNWKNCLPAYKMYTGRIFSQVNIDNWQKAKDVLLVSPLWGIIKPEDMIPKYTLEMSDYIFSKKNNLSSSVWKIWRPVLDELIHELSDGQTTFSLLYNKSSRGFSVNTRNTFECPVPNWRDNYGHYKGEWLNDYLSSK